jgi:cyclic dehypoxanthinyl futalosine synthase
MEHIKTSTLMALETIIKKVQSRVRLDCDDILTLYQQADFYQLGQLAQGVRFQKHPEPSVSYVVDRNINYSNVCVCGCRFCAFYRAPGHPEAYVLTKEALIRKIEETISLGGTQILMQGGHHPHLPLSFYEELLSFIKTRFAIHIHAFSPPEIVHFAKLEKTGLAEVISRLRTAGLDSIPGGGAEILVDAVRKRISPNKCSAKAWLQVMEEAHRQGLRTTATMMFGHEEQPSHRIEHLLALRDLQDRTGGFTAFIPWPFQPTNTAIHRSPETPVAYLRLLALARIVLDNFDNIQASWVTMGPKVAQLALHFGANDFGSTMIEENVVAAAGVHFRLSVHEIRRLIQDAGFQAWQRTMAYESVRDNETGDTGTGR